MAKVKSDAEWQAEYDADTLARYQEIMNDTKRRTAAMKAARSKANDLQKSLNNMNRVIKSKGR